MKLPFQLPFGKKENKEYFLALLLHDEKVHAVLFEEDLRKIRIVAHAQEQLPTLLENSPAEKWLDSLDRVISSVESSISNTLQTEKTIFGVKQAWVEEGKIKKDYLSKLKIVCDELALKPIGFLVFTEAIVHMLTRDEGAPVSALLIETGKAQVSISLIRAGRIVDTQQVPLLETLPKTVDHGLSLFESVEILPSRIILFSNESDKTSQAFISHSWSRSLPFLHVPQVTILPKNFDIKAILYGTASQMGFDILTSSLPEAIPTPAQQTIAPLRETKEHLSLDEDDATLAKKIEESIEHPEQIAEETSSDYFGFAVEKDVANIPTPKKTIPDTIPQKEMREDIQTLPEVEEVEETQAFKSDNFPTESKLLFASIFTGIKSILPKIGRIKPSMKGINIPATSLLIPIALVVLLVLGIVGYFFGMHATVTIAVHPQVISQNQTVSFVKDGSTDTNSNTIGTTEVSTDESDTANANATGSKDVGTPAKGSVTVFNVDSSPASLSANTKITASNGQAFTLDSSVNVPASNGDPTNLQSGQATVNVTATDIGTNGNVPSGTKFSFSNSSQIAAKNDTAFSGGTKKTVTVVSQKDLDGLVATLTKNLEGKAKDDLSKKIDSSQQLLPGFTTETISKKTFSKALGDEASSISLDGTITYTTDAYRSSDAKTLAISILKAKVPTDTNFSDNTISEDIQNITAKGNNAQATLVAKATLVPTIDTTSLTTQLAGKSFAQATNILQAIPQIANTTFVLQPNLPLLPQTLPHMAKNIKIQVVAQ